MENHFFVEVAIYYTWNLKMKVWKMFFLFKWVIFRFHVSFPGCRIEVYLVKSSEIPQE